MSTPPWKSGKYSRNDQEHLPSFTDTRAIDSLKNHHFSHQAYIAFPLNGKKPPTTTTLEAPPVAEAPD